MKSGMWPVAVGALLCAGLAGAQSVEMSAKPLTLSPGAEVGSKIRVVWKVQHDADVFLQVVDAAGKLVRTVDAGHMAAGEYNAIFDGKDFYGKALPAGDYALRLNAGFKPAADMSFGGGSGMLGQVTRKVTFKGDRKFDLGVKGFDVQTVKVKVDGEVWRREEDFSIAGDNYRADGSAGIIEFNPQATFNKEADIEMTVASGLPLENPWAVKTAPDGSLYIADNLHQLDGLNNLPKPREGFVYKVDAAGKPVTDFAKDGAMATIARDLAVDADGNLYVLPAGHSVDVYDSKGVLKYHVAGYTDPNTAADRSKGPAGAFSPMGIALNESKHLIIVNLNISTVIYDATKPDLTGFLGFMDGKHGAQMVPVKYVWLGPCVAATRDCFYQTTCWSNIYKYRFDAARGEFSTLWTTTEHAPGPKLDGPQDLWHALGMDLDHSGLIYVADRENHRVHVFFDAGPKYKDAGSFGSAGTDAGKCQMMAPHAICLSPDGKFLYVADDGFFIKEADNPMVYGLARVTKLKLGFDETVEAKLTVK